jgi:hypothetical protein
VSHKSNSVAKNLIFSLTPPGSAINLRGNLVAMKWRKASASAWVVTVLAIAAGCATQPPTTDEQAVERRAMERWNAVIAGDYKKAYAFISPAGRALVTAEAYEGTFRRDFHKGARVTEVRCSKELCDVTLEIEYDYQGRRLKTPLWEKWVRQDSDWWYLYQR